jgi:hypothetical protein
MTATDYLAVEFDDKTMMIRLNGKLVVAYRTADLGPELLKGLLDYVRRWIEQREHKDRREALVTSLLYPCVGTCTLCGEQANLLGGLCYLHSYHSDD